MPVTNEQLAEHDAATAELAAADDAKKAAEQRVVAAEARLETVRAAIVADMAEGEIRTLLPTHVPSLAKVNGKAVPGFVLSLHPDAPSLGA